MTWQIEIQQETRADGTVYYIPYAYLKKGLFSFRKKHCLWCHGERHYLTTRNSISTFRSFRTGRQSVFTDKTEAEIQIRRAISEKEKEIKHNKVINTKTIRL